MTNNNHPFPLDEVLARNGEGMISSHKYIIESHNPEKGITILYQFADGMTYTCPAKWNGWAFIITALNHDNVGKPAKMYGSSLVEGLMNHKSFVFYSGGEGGPNKGVFTQREAAEFEKAEGAEPFTVL